MTNQQGAPEALAHELFTAAQLAPGEGISDAVARIAALVEAQQPAPRAPRQAARSTDQVEEILRERDDAEDFIDALLDEVLGHERPEWSSAYGRADALNDVRERMTALHKPAVDKAWDQFQSAIEAPQQPAPSAAAAGQRRSDLVPGVMHCAKCKFQLNRVTLCVSDGNAYAGNNETEPCPNGCGPLWPVTWEQEARNCWKALEEMHERLHPAPTPQADSRPAPVEVADAMADSQYLAGVSAGWNAANADDPNAALQKLQESRAGHLKPLRAARAQADSVTAPAGPSKPLPYEPTSAMLIAARERDPALPIETVRAIYWSMWRTAPTPPAQAADGVLEDAARLDWLALAGPTSICLVIDRPHDGEIEVATDDVIGYGKTLREALDAARKQGAIHEQR